MVLVVEVEIEFGGGGRGGPSKLSKSSTNEGRPFPKLISDPEERGGD